jgi:hypothetical protein
VRRLDIWGQRTHYCRWGTRAIYCILAILGSLLVSSCDLCPMLACGAEIRVFIKRLSQWFGPHSLEWVDWLVNSANIVFLDIIHCPVFI